MSETAGIILFGIGVVFNFFGCLGLIRLPDVYNRLQASTKCVTFGTIFLLIGVMVYLDFSAITIKALLCLVFILITSPTAAHAISRGAYKSKVPLWKKSVVDQYAEAETKGE